MGIGDWGLGIGDWGLGPIPNPQSPIPNPHNSEITLFNKFIHTILIYNKLFCGKNRKKIKYVNSNIKLITAIQLE